MSIDPETIGTGAGGGLLGTFLAWLGFRDKINKQDEKISKLSESVVYKDTCNKCIGGTNERLDRIEKKVEKIDSISDCVNFIKGKLEK